MIYLSGKITDETRDRETQNMQRFFELEQQFIKDGVAVFNPAVLEEPGWTWEQYLARDLFFIYQSLPTMYMMKGWEDSRGARLEYETAKLLGLEIEYEG